MEYTSNYKLKKPSAEDFYNIQDFNENADLIDAKMKVADEAKALADDLTAKESALEAKVTALQTKSRILLTVLAPVGTKVTLQRSGCPTVSGTVGSGMELDLELSEIGSWTMNYSYQSYSGSRSVEVGQVGKNYVTAAPTLELSPWAYIDKVSQRGLAAELYNLGDLKTIQVGEETCKVQIVAFDHDVLSSPSSAGRKTAGITFHLQDTLATAYQGHADYKVASTWATRDLRLKHLPAIMATLDADLQTVIKTVDKTSVGEGRTDNSYSVEMVTTQDQLFLPSERELLGYTNRSGSHYNEGYIYEYYKAGNKIYKSNKYWTRSSYESNVASNGESGVVCMTSNTTNILSLNSTACMAFMFCV